ncbi:MAG: hybrid sensor histidine kinase/response regulator, partial [Gammaproteobacteria bacterium]
RITYERIHPGFHRAKSMTPPITTKATAILDNLLRHDGGELAAEQLFLKAAIALSSAQRDTVFDDLTHSLVELLDVDIAMIGVHGTGAKKSIVEAIALSVDGKWVRDYRYDLTGTPCESVVGKGFKFYTDGVQRRFTDPDLKRMNIEGYAAVPLVGADGSSLGLITVMTHQSMQHRERVEAVLRLFSERAVVEIERARTESALKASEELYGSVFNAALDGIVMLTLDAEIVDVNPALLKMTGSRREELIGRNITDFEPDPAKAAAFYQEVRTNGKACSEGATTRKDGKPFYCEYRAVLVQFRGREHILEIVRDITERKDAEAQRAVLEEQLRRAQRMEAVGQLTGGIAHDFNNILTGLLGYVEIARDHSVQYQDDKLNRYLDRAQRSGARARELIQQMLTFSRGSRGRPRPVDLAQASRDMMALLESTLPSTVEVIKRLPERLPPTVLDPIHFEQVLLNLCINSRDAMNGAGTLTIELTERHCADCFCCASCQQPLDGRFVELAISDTGPGIPSEVQPRMFEPFFSTKEPGKGSGMGLAIVHGIVHEYGGHLVVKTAPGQGTTIRVLLPCDPEALSQAVASQAPATGTTYKPRLAGRVLCVDDNRDVGEFVRELLESWGLEVVSFDDARKALAEVLDHLDDFEFALLDQTMPQLAGLELAKTLMQRRGDLPVLLYTGYSDQINEDVVKAAGIRALIKKPLDIPHFRRLVDGILGSTSATNA